MLNLPAKRPVADSANVKKAPTFLSSLPTPEKTHFGGWSLIRGIKP